MVVCSLELTRDQCKLILRLSPVDRNRKETCYRMRGTEVMSPENYSYAAGIFVSGNAQTNEGE